MTLAVLFRCPWLVLKLPSDLGIAVDKVNQGHACRAVPTPPATLPGGTHFSLHSLVSPQPCKWFC